MPRSITYASYTGTPSSAQKRTEEAHRPATKQPPEGHDTALPTVPSRPRRTTHRSAINSATGSETGEIEYSISIEERWERLRSRLLPSFYGADNPSNADKRGG